MRSALRLLFVFAVAGCASKPAPPLHPATIKLQEEIAGRENLPAGEVFRNVQLLKNVSAGRLLKIMDSSFSRGLGVHCEQCHTPDGRWASDDKRTKLAAREMIVMMRATNAEIAAMQHLDESEPSVSCVTCHRGKLKPPPFVE